MKQLIIMSLMFVPLISRAQTEPADYHLFYAYGASAQTTGCDIGVEKAIEDALENAKKICIPMNGGDQVEMIGSAKVLSTFSNGSCWNGTASAASVAIKFRCKNNK